jgi:hypothetical protein
LMVAGNHARNHHALAARHSSSSEAPTHVARPARTMSCSALLKMVVRPCIIRTPAIAEEARSITT